MKPIYIMVLLGMGLVTFIPRWLPLYFFSRQRLPGWVVRWLELIPVAIISALLTPELITGDAPRQLMLFRPEMWVAIPTFFFAFRTKSLGGTVVFGMALFWMAGKLI